MATTATMPDCQTAPATAFLGCALQNMMLQAAAVSMIIWMMMFIFGRLMASARVLPSCTWIIWQNAKRTMMSSADRKTNTEALASFVICLSSVVALLPYI